MPDFMELSNVRAALPWGTWEPLALFFVSAGAAAALLACAAALLRRDSTLVRACGIAALASGAAGQASLLMGLEQPLRAYEFYLRPHFTSWTAWGAYVIPLLLLGSLLLVWRSRRVRVSPLWCLPALAGAVLVFVYAGNEIRECVGRALWATPLLTPTLVVAGLTAACAFTALAVPAERAARPPFLSLVVFAVIGAFLCAAATVLYRPPAGYAAFATLWWNAPGLVALGAAILALVCLRLFHLPRLAAVPVCLSAFMVYWKIIHMGQAFDRAASTFSDADAWADIFSPSSLLALAGGAGLWLALILVLGLLFPVRAAGSRTV